MKEDLTCQELAVNNSFLVIIFNHNLSLEVSRAVTKLNRTWNCYMSWDSDDLSKLEVLPFSRTDLSSLPSSLSLLCIKRIWSVRTPWGRMDRRMLQSLSSRQNARSYITPKAIRTAPPTAWRSQSELEHQNLGMWSWGHRSGAFPPQVTKSLPG